MPFSLQHQLATLEVTGEDANKYLQGQLTNDINSFSSSNSQLSAHLNNKGRIFANFIILKQEDNSFYLLFPSDLLDAILPRLKMFILRSKVNITQSDKSVLLDTQEPKNNPYYKIGNYFIRLSESQESKHELFPINDWHKLLVTNELPFIYQNTSQQIIPQQINLDLMDAVNFKKGCYTGQEIVARTHYLGKVKRRLVKFTIDERTNIGTTITSRTIDNQEIGFVIDCYEDNSITTGLASIQLDYINNAQINCKTVKCIQIGESNE